MNAKPIFSKHLARAIQFSHELINQRLSTGGVAVDATVGNGHDTVFLANLVGETGTVIGFDVQQQAIENTQDKTETLHQVQLHQQGHETISDVYTGPIDAAIFNLGYLPGADKQIVTVAETTIIAVEAILTHLKPAGIVCIILYTGHEGGKLEAKAIHEWTAQLDQEQYTAVTYQFINQKNNPPHLLAIERKK